MIYDISVILPEYKCPKLDMQANATLLNIMAESTTTGLDLIEM